jgi:hypothetical protein
MIQGMLFRGILMGHLHKFWNFGEKSVDFMGLFDGKWASLREFEVKTFSKLVNTWSSHAGKAGMWKPSIGNLLNGRDKQYWLVAWNIFYFYIYWE